MNTINDTIRLLICGTILAAIFMTFFIWLFFLQRKKQNEYYLERARLLYEAERKEISARMEEREIMMNQMSKEVHDNIGQIANLVRMHFHEIERVVKTENLRSEHKLLQYIRAGGKFSDELVENAHHISYSLNSDLIKEKGLIRVISEQLDQIASIKKIEKELEITEDEIPILPEQSLIIYRIAQEALNNIVKHSQATFIRVSLIHRANFFKMIIVDNGIGLTGKDLAKGRMGISNMKQRAGLLGGDLTIISDPSEGCRIILTINNLYMHDFTCSKKEI